MDKANWTFKDVEGENVNLKMGVKWNAQRKHNKLLSLCVQGKERCQLYGRKFTLKMTKCNRQ